MSRILFLSQLLPYPLDTGPKVRSYYVIRHLAQIHKVTLLAFSRPDDTQEAVQHMREFCEDVHLVMLHRSRGRNIVDLFASLLTGDSFIIRRDYVREMSRAVNQLVKTCKYDAIHSDQLWMAQYALEAKSAIPEVKLVLDEHNACFKILQRLAVGEHNLLKRMILELEWRKLRVYEARASALFDCVVTVTKEDHDIILDLIHTHKERIDQPELKSPKNGLVTIPICVETQSTAPVQSIPGTLNVLYMGTMFFLPNIEGVLWFSREVWPMIVSKIPQATFTIVGKNPPSEIKALTNGKNSKLSIQITGYVPDPIPYLERAGVFIVPLHSGGGMRVKIVDAWRWGLPIVSTSVGAEGIHYQAGENILIADTPEDFAQATIQVLSNPILVEKLRINGRQWVEENYYWRKVYSAWDSIYN